MDEKHRFDEDVEEIEADLEKNIFMFVDWRKDWFIFLRGTIYMCTSAVSTPLNTWIYGNIMGALSDYYLGEFESYDQFIKQCLILCGGLMIVGVGKMVFVTLGISTWMKFGEIQQSRARRQVFSKILNQNTKFYDLNPNIMGELTQVNRCIEELRSGTSEIIGETIQTAALILGLTVISFIQSWAIALIILASAPVMAAFAWYFGRLSCVNQEDENEKSSKASKIMDWCLVSPMSVRAFNGKYIELVKFNRFVSESARAYYGVANAVSANSGVLKFLTLMMFVQGFWFGNFLLTNGKVTINQVFTCFSSCLMLGQSISEISQLMAVMNTAHAAAGRISTYLNKSSEKNCEEKKHQCFPLSCFGKISFINVRFKYPARDNLVLNDVSFKFLPNKMNYLVGTSGSGKSTIPLLLMKLYASSGYITIDGIDIELLDPSWISQNITLVQQTPIVFEGTIRENVALAVIDEYESLECVPLKMIRDAAEFALLDLDLDQQITSSSLSGGQRQRLAIARAKLKDSPVLILDEAFSALDEETKQQLIKRVHSWRRGRTTIVITHEYNHIETDDNVVVMENGRVIEQGRFRNLRNSLFFTSESLKKRYKSAAAAAEASTHEKKRCSIEVEEMSIESNTDTDIEAQVQESEHLMGVLAILKYCSETIDAKAIIILGVILSILEGGASPVFSFCFSKLLSTTLDASIGKNIDKAIIQWSSVSIAVALFVGMTAYASKFCLSYASERWVISLRKLSLQRINGQDMSFFENIKPAQITTLLMNDTRDLRNLVSSFLSVAVNLFVMVLLGIIWAIVSGWKLALVGISFVPLIFLITAAYGRVLESAENRYKTSVATLETLFHQTVTSIKTIKLFYMNKHFYDKFEKDMRDLHCQGTYRAIQTGIGLAINELITAIATGVILYFGMELAGTYKYNHEQLLQVITLLTFTLTNASSLIHQLPEITRGQRAGTFIVKLLEDIPFSRIENDGEIIPRIKNPVLCFENVSFGYGYQSVLDNVTFCIEKNQLIGLVGKSGTGKSTISFLILRLLKPDTGSIQIYNKDVSNVNIDWLRETISIVPQFPKFFEGTILENLIYGISPIKQISMEELNKHLVHCGMYDFVVSLPEGIHTRIGEGANTLLSGGQLQRLSIVRALLRRPKILIFDECTSNLDPTNATLIMELIMSLKHQYTILCITHDEKLMQHVDRVIELNRGSAIERI
ncbi:HST6 [Candida oxycetoniae]|uniref:HST6 n=1 Tax=Candida oxycetoniae TaxID=497107 RepID=A0AAI9SZP9_9ASCO|nr:HST6 [Candida oxycetoniae]KAI3406138.2 HST6 [Candida oxycetoniae]